MVAAAAGTVVSGGFALAAMRRYGGFWEQSDAEWYRKIAEGRSREVLQPFVSRQLHPQAVRWLAGLLHWPLERMFAAIGAVCLLVVLGTVFGLMMRTAAPRWILAMVVLVPFWPQLWTALALPDLWYAAMIAALLWLLAERRWLAAAMMMFPLMVSRESTSLTLVCLLLAAWRELRWRGAAVAVAGCAAGSWIVRGLAAGSPGNIEKIPQSLYLLGKAPLNLVRNVFGVQPWSNIYPLLCDQPRWMWRIHVGPVQAVGACSLGSPQPRIWLDAQLAVFGVLPLLAVLCWWWTRRERRGGGDGSAMLRFCLIYGVVGFMLTPLMGTGVYRLVGYSWPLALVAGPMLAGGLRGGWRTGALLATQLGLCLLGLHLLPLEWPVVGLEAALFATGGWLVWGMLPAAAEGG